MWKKIVNNDLWKKTVVFAIAAIFIGGAFIPAVGSQLEKATEDALSGINDIENEVSIDLFKKVSYERYECILSIFFIFSVEIY